VSDFVYIDDNKEEGRADRAKPTGHIDIIKYDRSNHALSSLYRVVSSKK
jgi:hypothetical protein